ncbi:MAG: oligopeptide/dipeptide ABC transporter ATP-binding protein, partial [Cellulosilyticaceae bacterium]
KHELYDNPTHPYTRALLSSTPVAHPKLKHKKERIILTGDVPSPINPPKGCHFHTRCYMEKVPQCMEVSPRLVDVSGERHLVACHLCEKCQLQEVEDAIAFQEVAATK